MVSPTGSPILSGPVAILYAACFLLLLGLTLSIGLWARGTRSGQRRSFVLLSVSLLVWLCTLFLEVRVSHTRAQLWLGRTNFAAVVLAAYFAWRFVQTLSDRIRSGRSRWPLASTTLLALLSLCTPLVSAAEQVRAGHAVTTFGPLFPLYLFHVHGYLGAALWTAVRQWRWTRDLRKRRQLALIGGGMLGTGTVAAVTNALLPYLYGDFRFCHVGTLSTVFFTVAVAIATFFHGLFNLRVVVKKTLVYGVLLSFVLGAYSSAVFVISQYLTSSAEEWTQFVVLFLAFSFDPLRRFLEGKADQYLFGEEGATGRSRTSALRLALLFPWRRQ